MIYDYQGVNVRVLRDEERLVLSEEKEMPLVIEAKDSKDINFLKTFLQEYSSQILQDVARYGAVLFRGFDVQQDKDFEQSILSIQGFEGMSEVFMSEEGRIPVEGLKYVMHTNAVYKTGGTMYLGGFHSENYLTPDVPTYISFCCFKPSLRGGETGLINMEKVYENLETHLQEKLEKNSFFVTKWLVSEVKERYSVSDATIESICKQFSLPIMGEKDNRFIMVYKPSVLVDENTKKKSLHVNLYEVPGLNKMLRKQFMKDYSGKDWFWHRVVWRLPTFIFKTLEFAYIITTSFLYSPKDSLNIARTKYKASRALKSSPEIANNTKVGSCFTAKDIENLAQLMRRFYCSCLWQKGDILLIDNRKIGHAGMPGAGARLVRAMIGNPIEMKYFPDQGGSVHYKPRTTGTVGSFISFNADTL